MQKVMNHIISDSQAGFIPGRRIADNIILAHELDKSYNMKHISPRCMIKVDLQKAYDSVEWIYLEQVLEGLAFPEKGELESVQRLHQCFWTFSSASGVHANLSKSVVYCGGMDPMQKAVVIQALGYTKGKLPFKYLGVPLHTKKLSILQWQPLITKMVAKITSWTAKKLSYAGIAQLVQTVLFRIQSYWAQLFTLPVKVVKLIEAYCRSYLWSGRNTLTKKSFLAWEKVWNSAAIAKTYWDLTHKQDKLWIKWIHAYYVKRQRIDDMSIPQSASSMIRKIFEAKQIINQLHRPLDEQKSIIKHIYL
ncbi:uncharacterized protein [Nicotiana tomentosiformis]|uniref:uncharacterized protein n=1 Tax=Nicotiana tomentosiformis TaxID=4098 RepID=UPI00388C83CD